VFRQRPAQSGRTGQRNSLTNSRPLLLNVTALGGPRSRVRSDPGRSFRLTLMCPFSFFSVSCPKEWPAAFGARIKGLKHANSNRTSGTQRLDFAKIQGSIQIPNLLKSR